MRVKWVLSSHTSDTFIQHWVVKQVCGPHMQAISQASDTHEGLEMQNQGQPRTISAWSDLRRNTIHHCYQNVYAAEHPRRSSQPALAFTTGHCSQF